ncbi:CRISPR-associated endonuclease Cas1 [Nocardia alni]|uniref:CRISPR-associated endonuclease Cas1 n=1 Tax=Nocardia alni TaxID=2815723 RepID=UPI0020B28617|nr:CRISPR-associated endonuclease Cas1 [Nocardia alni]
MLSPGAAMLATEFSANGRNRQSPRYPVNALLSFWYVMLTKDLVVTTIGVGLDPYLGVYHRSRCGRPVLALDLAKEFRPLIADSTVLGLLNNGEIGPSDFIRRAGAVGVDAKRTPNCAARLRAPSRSRSPAPDLRISD